MPSPYLYNDYKRHFSINLDTGLWQDFKSGKSGNFISLYSFLEGITYKKAESSVLLKTYLNTDTAVAPKRAPVRTEELQLEPISPRSCWSENIEIQEAWCVLYARKLFNLNNPDAQFFYCREGRYADRIIIPFMNKDKMYFFQARALYPDQNPKYLNPPSDVCIKKSDVLYPFDYKESYVVVTEGPLDALSLQIQGVNATCTLGCQVSESQIAQLAEFDGKVILGYDNDAAGARGTEDFDTMRKEKRMDTPFLCPLPPSFKDWNEAHIADFDIKEWVVKESKCLSFENKTLDKLFKIE